MSRDQPLISIIIPTRNACDVLQYCLESIQSQTNSNLEIIVVDNYSSDGTLNMARKYCAKIITAGPPPLHNNFFTAPIQRRIGAEHASGDYLFFVDSDMIMDNGLVEELRNSIKDADAVVVPEISFGKGFWARCKVLERSCYLGDEIIEAPRFIKRVTYEKVGGWRDEVGGFDDWDLNQRLRSYGFKVIRSRHRIFHNEGHLTLRRLFIKKYRIGKSVNTLKYPSQHASSPKVTILQLTPIRLLVLLRRVTPSVLNPIEIFGVILMKIIEGTALIMGFLFSRMTKSLGL